MNVYSDAIIKYGEEHQINIAQEEMAELIVALSHYQRGRASIQDVASELADVQIMLEQMKIIFGAVIFNQKHKLKIDRLRLRIKEE